MTVSDELNALFRNFFNDQTIQIHDTMTASDIKGWDSLAHVDLIMTVENHFKIRFAIGELSALQNVGQMTALIKKKTSKT